MNRSVKNTGRNGTILSTTGILNTSTLYSSSTHVEDISIDTTVRLVMVQEQEVVHLLVAQNGGGSVEILSNDMADMVLGIVFTFGGMKDSELLPQPCTFDRHSIETLWRS